LASSDICDDPTYESDLSDSDYRTLKEMYEDLEDCLGPEMETELWKIRSFPLLLAAHHFVG
jgi:hypothetical protein